MKKISLIVTVAFIGLIVIALGFYKNSNNKQITSNKLQITTSFYPLYFFTKEIVGDKAEVYNLTPSGTEPHDYEPTAQDIVRIENSSLLILNGGNVEAWGNRIIQTINNDKIHILIAGQDILNKSPIKDPHIWLDPNLAKKESENITASILKIDPVHKDYYLKNAAELYTEFDELNTEFKKGLNDCGRRDIITSHAAFGYLAKAYDLHQLSISGLSPDEEPSSKQLTEIARFAEKQNIKYIFFERLVSPKLSQTLADEIGAQTLVLNPIEGITDKDMKDGKNYFTIMKENLVNLQKALECK